MKHRVLFLFFCSLLVLSLMASPLSAQVDIGAANAVLIDAKTGQILYGKSPYALSSSGDFNKLLTIITALEEFEELPTEITVHGTAILYNPTPPYLGLKEGQTVKLMDMLYAIYLGGYNDAANVVADTLGRQLLDTESKEFKEMTEQQKTNAAEDAYAKLMNRKADELLCPTMKATNPDGHFYDTQQCSPNDVAQLVRSALKNDTFRKIFMTPTYTITGNPKSVNNMHADGENKYKRGLEKAGENAEAQNLPAKPLQNYPYPTEGYPLEETNQSFQITTTNLLFRGDILYNGITGGINAYNKSRETYHSMVYAKNGERSLIAVVMNASETGFYDDLQALLNFGFYKWTEESISEKQLNKMLPNHIASRDLAFSGRTQFLLPADYNLGDLDYAVAYTENGYLSGTITLTLPEAANYAGTVTTVSFYETNEKSYLKPILIGLSVLAAIAFGVVVLLFLGNAYGTQKAKKTGQSQKNRPRQRGSKQKTASFTPPGKQHQGKEKSENRRKAEELRRKKEAQKRSNRRRNGKTK